jgi:hypothetical protein
VPADSTTAAELREQRNALAIVVEELRSGRLRHQENGTDISHILIEEWTAEIARLDDRLHGAGTRGASRMGSANPRTARSGVRFGNCAFEAARIKKLPQKDAGGVFDTDRNVNQGKPRRVLLSSEYVIEFLRAEVEKAGTESEWARRTGANRTSLNLTLNGRLGLQKNILDALGLEMVVAYVPRRRPPS